MLVGVCGLDPVSTPSSLRRAACYILSCATSSPPRTLTPRVSLNRRSPLATSLSLPDSDSSSRFLRQLGLDEQRLYGHDGGAEASHARSEGKGPEKGQFVSLRIADPSQALSQGALVLLKGGD